MVTSAFMSDMLGAVTNQHLVPKKLEEIQLKWLQKYIPALAKQSQQKVRNLLFNL